MTCPTSSHGISKRRPIYACFAAAMVLRARARTKSATRSRPASQNNLIVGSRQARLSNSPVSRSLDPINMAASHALPKGKAAHRAVLDEPRGCVLVSGASSSPDYGKRTTVESSLYSQNCLGATSRCYRVSSPVPIRPARTLGSAKRAHGGRKTVSFRLPQSKTATPLQSSHTDAEFSGPADGQESQSQAASLLGFSGPQGRATLLPSSAGASYRWCPDCFLQM
jgi:hypothetical protein